MGRRASCKCNPPGGPTAPDRLAPQVWGRPSGRPPCGPDRARLRTLWDGATHFGKGQQLFDTTEKFGGNACSGGRIFFSNELAEANKILDRLR